MNMKDTSDLIQSLTAETNKGFLGKEDAVGILVSGLLSGMHVLIEDVSGIGKTTLVKCLARASGLDFGRIQFTPDLLPGDITGMMIWDHQIKEFRFNKGPLNHSFILADELNRASARTQAALLEAMQEDTVTVDGISRPLPQPFFVAATQNPFRYTGTFTLPESQLDRFGLSFSPGYPERDTEAKILTEYRIEDPLNRVGEISGPGEILAIRQHILGIKGSPEVIQYLVDLAEQSRDSSVFQSGLSTRGARHLMQAAQCSAAREAREFIIPEDIILSAPAVMRHKLVLSTESRGSGIGMDEAIETLIRSVKIPSRLSL